MKDTSNTEIKNVSDAIYQAIAEHRLKPNTRLIESQLSKALSTSRVKVRQALLLLAQQKLVKIVQNKGAVVADPSENEAFEVFSARQCVEQEVLMLFCKQYKPDDIKVLRDHLEVEQQARKNHDRFELIRATGKFHLLLAEIAGNKVLLDFLGQLIARSSLILQKFKTHNDQTCNEGHHAELVQLITKGREEEVLQLMNIHLQELGTIISYKKTTKPANLSEIFSPLL